MIMQLDSYVQKKLAAFWQEVVLHWGSFLPISDAYSGHQVLNIYRLTVVVLKNTKKVITFNIGS